jgi:hypothetical protein
MTESDAIAWSPAGDFTPSGSSAPVIRLARWGEPALVYLAGAAGRNENVQRVAAPGVDVLQRSSFAIREILSSAGSGKQILRCKTVETLPGQSVRYRLPQWQGDPCEHRRAILTPPLSVALDWPGAGTRRPDGCPAAAHDQTTSGEADREHTHACKHRVPAGSALPDRRNPPASPV